MTGALTRPPAAGPLAGSVDCRLLMNHSAGEPDRNRPLPTDDNDKFGVPRASLRPVRHSGATHPAHKRNSSARSGRTVAVPAREDNGSREPAAPTGGRPRSCRRFRLVRLPFRTQPPERYPKILQQNGKGPLRCRHPADQHEIETGCRMHGEHQPCRFPQPPAHPVAHHRIAHLPTGGEADTDGRRLGYIHDVLLVSPPSLQNQPGARR